MFTPNEFNFEINYGHILGLKWQLVKYFFIANDKLSGGNAQRSAGLLLLGFIYLYLSIF